MKRLPAIQLYSSLLHAFMAVSALPAGYLLVRSPDGSELGLPPELLSGSPFDSYFIPRLVLFSVLGGLNLLLFILLVRKTGSFHYPSAMVGLALVGWILMQAYWIGWVSFLQPFYLAVGLTQAGLGLSVWRVARKKRHSGDLVDF